MSRFLAQVWLRHLRYVWSNARFTKTYDIPNKSLPRSFIEIRSWLYSVYKNYKWTADDRTMFWDAIDTPTSCLYKLLNATVDSPFKDDCDGFHAAVMEVVNRIDGCEAQLLTYATLPIKWSHTLLVVKHNGAYAIIDYDDVYYGYSSLQEVLDAVKSNKYKIFATEFSKWNKENGWITGWKA